MSVLIGVRIELRDAQGELVGAIYCEDKLEAVAVPQRGDLVALSAIVGPAAPDSSLAELQSVHGLADPFPFLRVDHLEHYPAADHQVGGQAGCMVVVHGCAPSGIDEATALVRLFALKGWIVSPTGISPEAANPFSRAMQEWQAQEGGPREN